jgi:short-subunit dehydrogenase
MRKVAWVTGASSGIGEEICKQLAEKGFSLILSSRDETQLNAVKSKLSNANEHLVIPIDLSDTSNIHQLVEVAIAQFPTIDFVYHCGGISQRSEAAETPLSVDRKIMEVNYFGCVALTKAILPHFQQQKSGHFVVISSISGKFGFFLRSAYSASKHALQGFFESLLLEEAKHNIRVTIAYPGKINTPISLRALDKNGNPHGKMDHNQETGMPVDVCVKKLIRAVEKNKKEVLIGNKELGAVYLKRFVPSLFWKVIAKQKAT